MYSHIIQTNVLLDETALIRSDNVILITVGAVNTAVHSLDEHLIPVRALMGESLQIEVPLLEASGAPSGHSPLVPVPGGRQAFCGCEII